MKGHQRREGVLGANRRRAGVAKAGVARLGGNQPKAQVAISTGGLKAQQPRRHKVTNAVFP